MSHFILSCFIFLFRLLTLGTTTKTFLFYIFSVDLVSGFNIATVNHDSRIDWLEVRHSLIPIPIYLLRCENRTREAWPKGARRVMGRRKAKDRFSPLSSFLSPLALLLTALPSLIVVNSRNKTGEERRRQTLCDNRDNSFVRKNFSPNYSFLGTDRFVKDQKTLMLREDHDKTPN